MAGEVENALRKRVNGDSDNHADDDSGDEGLLCRIEFEWRWRLRNL